MSIFGDVTDDILGEDDDLNDAVVGNYPPSETEEDDNGEEKVNIKVEPKKRSVRNPRPRLTIETLTGPRGIHTLENYFKEIKLHGKGHEKKDLDEIMRRLQHWAHRMYPNYKFDDVLTNIERLGKKKQLQNHLNRYRQGLLEHHSEPPEGGEQEEQEALRDEPFDEFDALLGEQIAISKLASRTPSHYGDTSVTTSAPNTPKFAAGNAVASTPQHNLNTNDDREEGEVSTSQPQSTLSSKLSAEQMARIAENRRLAQERLKARREATKQPNNNALDL